MDNAQKRKRNTSNRIIVTAVVATAVPSMLLFSLTTAQAQLDGGTGFSALDSSSAKRTFDILRGQNKPGPYTLSWNRLRLTRSDSPVVVNVDGNDLTPDAYTIDANKGLITFRDPLKDTSMARVEYNYDALFSRLNKDAAASAVPVTLPVTQLGGGTSLQLTAVSGAGSTASDTAKLVWGLGNKTRLLGGGLTSQLFLGDGANGKTGVMDRTGMKFAYGVGNTRNGLDAQFQRAGGGFAPTTGKAFGMGDAQQSLSLNSRLAPMKWLGAGYTFGQSNNLLGNNRGTQDGMTLKLGGVKPTDTVLNYQMADNKQTDAAGNHLNTNSNKADFTTALAPTMGFTAKTSLTDTNATDATKTATVQDTSFGLTSKNAKGNITQAALTVTDGMTKTTNATENRQGIALQLQPMQTMTFNIAQNDKITDPIGTNNTVNAEETTFGLASKNAKGNVTQASLAVTDGTTKAVDSIQSHQAVTVKLQPAPKLTLTLAQNAQVTDPTAPTATKSSQEQMTVGAELTPAPNTKLTGSVQQGEVNAVKSSATNLDAQFNLSKAVAVAGGITSRDSSQGGVAGLDSTRVRLSLQTAPGVAVTTGVVMNPLASDGTVSQGQQQDVGLTLKQGAWEVGSGYKITTLQGLSASDTRGLAEQSGEMSFSLGLKVSPLSKFTCAYKNNFLYGNTNPSVVLGPRGLQAYSMNFTQTLGQTLNLTLGGSVTDDRSKVSQPQDIKAEAKLGVKF